MSGYGTGVATGIAVGMVLGSSSGNGADPASAGILLASLAGALVLLFVVFLVSDWLIWK